MEAAKKIYSPAINPRTGQELFASLVPGTELGWGVQALGPEPSNNIYDQYRYVVFKDPNWDWKTFNFDSDVVRGDQPENLIMNATDPNMKAFFAHGGKLLLYHGWSDPNVPAVNTIKYYNSVVENLGGAAKASSSVRLFMAPGMGHCGGGEGPNVFDKMAALERWVEQGKAPDALIATHSTDGKVDRSRPLCPYPQVAKYKGTRQHRRGVQFRLRRALTFQPGAVFDDRDLGRLHVERFEFSGPALGVSSGDGVVDNSRHRVVRDLPLRNPELALRLLDVLPIAHRHIDRLAAIVEVHDELGGPVAFARRWIDRGKSESDAVAALEIAVEGAAVRNPVPQE